MLRRLGKTPDDLLSGSADVQLSHSFCFRPTLEFKLSLDRDEHQRALAKIAFELLACHRADLAHRPELDGVRAIIGLRTGIPDVSLDLHAPGSGLLVESSLSTFMHTVEVWSAGKFLVGKVTLFGFLPFTIAFTDQWAAGPIRIAYAIDPLNASYALEFSDELNGTLPASWPQRLGQSIQEIEDRVRAFANAYLKRLNELCVEQAVQDIMDIWKAELRNTIMPGEPIPIEARNRIIELAADFARGMRLGGERKEPIPIQAILPKIREHYERLRLGSAAEREDNS
jgi:hypothetical protein